MSFDPFAAFCAEMEERTKRAGSRDQPSGSSSDSRIGSSTRNHSHEIAVRYHRRRATSSRRTNASVESSVWPYRGPNRYTPAFSVIPAATAISDFSVRASQSEDKSPATSDVEGEVRNLTHVSRQHGKTVRAAATAGNCTPDSQSHRSIILWSPHAPLPRVDISSGESVGELDKPSPSAFPNKTRQPTTGEPKNCSHAVLPFSSLTASTEQIEIEGRAPTMDEDSKQRCKSVREHPPCTSQPSFQYLVSRMPSQMSNLNPFSAKRLSEAEQRAAKSYNPEAAPNKLLPSSVPTPEQRPTPPLSLRQRGLPPAYKPRIGSVSRGRGLIHEAAECGEAMAAPVHLTEEALAAHDQELGTSTSYTRQQGTQASTTGSSVPPETSAMETEFQALVVDNPGATYKSSYGAYRQPIKSGGAGRAPIYLDFNCDERPAVGAAFEYAAANTKQDATANNVINFVKGEGEGMGHRCEETLEPRSDFTSWTWAPGPAAPVALVNVPDIYFHQTVTAEQLLTPHRAAPSTSYRNREVLRRATIANIRTTVHKDTSISQQPLRPTSLADRTRQLRSPKLPSPHSIAITPERPSTMSQEVNTPAEQTISSSGNWKMKSEIEAKDGVLRTTSDGPLGGNIIEESTGDIVELNSPDDAAQKYYEETDKNASTRRINAPEAKNGGTLQDDPRARKPIGRVLKNWWTGSSRPPPDEPMKIFQVGHKKPGKANLEEMIDVRRHQGDANVRYTVQKIFKRFWAAEMVKEFGEDWVNKADANDVFMRKVENFVIGLAVDKTKTEDQEEASEAPAVDPKALKKERKSWCLCASKVPLVFFGHDGMEI
ncbi:hypothetical protein BU23DRAFT_574072 [Bimuria novae-zelandiae CBS 107.79]|uniref:Uncharacterized protein n=1 Tax=Bimuria novae-zelandiae CBS 107.79 TaxID=1447943 RepID=A0A6A5UU60_9PLEO|nr:hypothetical protein BU23DRAFT_574072 [Bimuria novae-zelandiae CBS 107.79]